MGNGWWDGGFDCLGRGFLLFLFVASVQDGRTSRVDAQVATPLVACSLALRPCMCVDRGGGGGG